jgi:hypothetical protein
LLEENDEVSKSRTCWNAPAWNAECMFMSSGRRVSKVVSGIGEG